ncbi:phosphate acyltransferase PlsX [Actinobacillus pleuropneumoniae]|uniref:phosphate acyltransferase PlsX n=1 Tax=Actinobacillus pleuropneumoniae TaxID=715 RepID=UPI0001E49A07|nr:phosphate acyltransferase PlsX [Actinobacillus pleuropneumoniae]EFM95951.1 Fatty acid/phospholipid synthesis protein plsX [Actinobacillus pleuropneumoniae serovar 10 str. D13039]UKH33253.1 phosphate acyltransferase PlsX [Actinobacillus pleuropneumoniae serovar 10 str. D13039]
MNRLTLALDVMGGDFGPRITIPALSLALEKNPMLSFVLFGDQSQCSPLLNSLPATQQQRITFVHTSRIIEADIPFTQALRQSKGSSMRLALEAVARGEAQGCVSGGNTGALMGLAKLLIKPLPNIERPALTTLIPSMNGKSSVMLDLGANVEADSQLLCQFAEMGNIFAEVMLDLVHPRLALLNIGTEENKGNQIIRDTHQLLKQRYDLNYIGFIESDKLMNHFADVIICDGFSGNIALKALEGAAKNILSLLKKPTPDSHLCQTTKRYLLRAIFYRYYRKLQQINPDRHNGATLLGLSSVVVKSHGGAGVNAYFYAIDHAIGQIRSGIPDKISQGLNRLHQNL